MESQTSLQEMQQDTVMVALEGMDQAAAEPEPVVTERMAS
jgi:hypothetical protein